MSSSQGAYLAETMNLGAEIKSLRDRQGAYMSNAKEQTDLMSLKQSMYNNSVMLTELGKMVQQLKSKVDKNNSDMQEEQIATDTVPSPSTQGKRSISLFQPFQTLQ